MDLHMEQATMETGWRGSPDVWLDAAYDLLLETGVDSVRILPLAKRLNLSRTSFYWFFKDRNALLDALIERWREKNTGGLVQQCEAYADTIVEAMLNVSDCWFDDKLFDSKFEFAVRSWALQSPDLLKRLNEADDLRIAALANMFRRHGFPPSNADVRARATYLVQIGYISMQVNESWSVRLQRLSDYVAILTGEAPQPRDLDRFAARHAKNPEPSPSRKSARTVRQKPAGKSAGQA